MYGLLGCLLPTALKKRWSGKGRSSHAHTTPKLMESMANCCWCGDCHSFEILDEIYYLIWFHWVSTILLRKVCVFLSFILFSSGQFCLWNSLPHEGSLTQGKKVRRWCFSQLQNCTTKENSDSFSFLFFRGLKNFEQSPPWLSILWFLIKDKERKHMWWSKTEETSCDLCESPFYYVCKHLFMTYIRWTCGWHRITLNNHTCLNFALSMKVWVKSMK
jgi:hypothetical protein